MKSLYEYLRDANPGGIPHRDAVQLFLWIFCTKYFLPLELRSLELSKEVLVDTFQRLSVDGSIIEMNLEQALPSWENLVREFLLGNCAREEDFPTRAAKYLQARY